MALKSSMHILICEPDKAARTMTRSIFGQIGFKNISFSTDLKESLELIASNLKEQFVQLFLFDGTMEEENLKMLTIFIKKISSKKSPKLLALITNSDPDIIVKLIDLEINQILIKPFNQNQLTDKIMTLFNQ